MLGGSCHCGKVRFEVPGRPEHLILCNCSICRRYGVLWAFYARDEVRLSGHPEHTRGYIWGERTIETFHCSDCGCVTHWESLTPKPDGKISLNMRNVDPDELGEVRLRRFDGAQSWTYLD